MIPLDERFERLHAKPSEPRMSAKTSNSTTPTSRRTKLRERADQLLEKRIAFIASDRFAEQSATPCSELVQQVELGVEVGESEGARGLPPHLQRLCATPLLAAEDERELFFRMNYCKYHAAAIQATMHPSRPSEAKVRDAEEHLVRADRLRNYLLRANTRLVMSIARKFADARNGFDELLSTGLTSLVRAVEKFDCDRGYRFSTYATCAVRRDLNRMVMNRRRDSQRFAATPGEVLETVAEDNYNAPEPALARWRKLSSLLGDMMEELDEREKQIIRARFGFDEIGEKPSFSHLGKRLGISKERVRQLANRAMEKLREHNEIAALEALS